MMLVKRLFDIFLASFLCLFFIWLFLLVAIFIRISSKGPIIYWSSRVGKNNHIFNMPKFRTMKINTPNKATHLMKEPEGYLTPVGAFLRRTSLDELPQLFSILNGEMSFVGPRPALFNQNNLIALREKSGVNKLAPGLTGWAQVNGRDTISIDEKVKLDLEYLNKKSFWFDLKILWMTFLKVLRSEGITH